MAKKETKLIEIKDRFEKIKTDCTNLDRNKITKLEKKLLNLETLMKKQKKKIANKSEVNNIDKKSKELLYKLRMNYLMSIVSDYNCEIDIENYLKKNYQELKKKSILNVISNDKLIKNTFMKLLKEEMPKHPKDEFTETREMKRHFVIHLGGTNSGKTYNAIQALLKSKKGVYLAPLRLLALELFYTINQNGVLCDLSTGEEDILVPGSKHVSSTIEKANLNEEYDIAVIDEAQMIADYQRGKAWTKAILGLKSKEIHICCSPDALNIITKIILECEDTFEVNKYQRNTPLIVEEDIFKFPKSVKKGDALVLFSKRNVIKTAVELSNKGIKTSILYGNLPPDTRRRQMDMFKEGETDVVVTTDVIGMGVNLPIRRVVFLETSKYDGQDISIKWNFNSKEESVNKNRDRGKRKLLDTEIKQIAGRAGRKGLFDEGYVNTISDKEIIKEALEKDLEEINEIFYFPLDQFIFNLSIGTLRERLVAWLDSAESYKHIKKGNIDEQLKLLEILDSRFKKENISLENKYKLIFIPFDSKKEQLQELWIEYINKFLKNENFSMPILKGRTLDNLELYYRELDLYYSFCKEMKIEFEREKVMEIKNETSLKIHELLKNSVKKLEKSCSDCGKNIGINPRYNLCSKCFNNRYHFYN